YLFYFFFSSRRRHTRFSRDWSSDVCSSDLSNQIQTYAGYTPRAIVDYVDAAGQRSFHAWRTELGWARDTRNDFFMPTSGTYQRVGLELTLPGSTAEYYKLNYQFSRYRQLSPAFRSEE